jgi:2'-hydroxyisoflavone reductase
MAGFGTVNCAKAIEAGLRIRPLTETIRDTLNWQATRPADYQWRGGLTPEREAELLQEWDRLKRKK